LQAAVLENAAGRIAILGPTVDELRPQMARVRLCLQRAAFEPKLLNPWQTLLVLPDWREVLEAAEQLLTM
jgi:hypothetical protein